jgi:bacillithiol biosynthesis cysteine-adding enzyme BshC
MSVLRNLGFKKQKLLPLQDLMAFTKSNISLSETGQFSKLIIDYIGNNNALKEFYTYEPRIESFPQAIEDRNKAALNRDILVDALKGQYKETGISGMEASIERLADKNTYTVCTGHQLCLFTGPLYFIYKLISTINLAETLKKRYPASDFIPIYWMATEDHDFEEISSINLFGKKLKWDNAATSGAVGRLASVSLVGMIEELKQIMGETEQAKKLTDLFTQAYLNHPNVADATRWLVHQLFGSYGLLIIDGDHAKLKSTFAAVMKDDLLNHTNHQLVNQTISWLEKQSIKAQVNPRPINCFYMLDHLRERIELAADNVYKVANTAISFTKEALLEELDKHPERFSPNVVLRPLYQQHILPNLAYVGGPGELAYWLEYKSMFDHHRILFPVLIPRNFALLMDERIEQQFTKAGFEMLDLFKDTETLIKELVTRNTTVQLSLEEQQTKMAGVFAEISERATAVDSTLKSSVEAEFQKASNAIKNIESKLMRSEKQKQETGINQVKKIKEKFFPEDALQERYDNFIPYYLKSGDGFIADLKDAFDPFDYRLMVLKVT